MDEGPTTERLDEILEVLADRRRRLLIYHLAAEECVDREDLVSHLCARDPARSGRPPSEQSVSTDIHHTHLPKLRNADLIETDDDRTLRFHPPPVLEAILPVLRRFDPDVGD